MRARKILALAGCAALLTIPLAAGTAAAEDVPSAAAASAQSGEQAGAAEVRALLASGTFCVAYTRDDEPFRLIAQDGKRLLQTGREGGKKANAIQYKALYMDGNYYQFDSDNGKLYARILPERALTSPVLNPEENWQDVPDDLALPEELRIFFADEMFAQRAPSLTAPVYEGSTDVTVADKTYRGDLYRSAIRTQAGTDAGFLRYTAAYSGRKLALVQKHLVKGDQATLLETVRIESLSNQIPVDVFTPKTAVPVYKAGMGGMNDLLGAPESVGTIGGGKADAK